MATTTNTSQTSLLRHRTWTRQTHVISTDHTLIPLASVNAMFASTDVYWANPLPEAIMAETLANSLCFGLYLLPTPTSTSTLPATTCARTEPKLEFIGLARCITDSTTFLYLTDVHILPEHQGGGLGKWLISCVDEVIGEMGFLRRAMLFTSDWERSVPFYEKELGMSVLGGNGKREGVAIMARMGPGMEGTGLAINAMKR